MNQGSHQSYFTIIRELCKKKSEEEVYHVKDVIPFWENYKDSWFSGLPMKEFTCEKTPISNNVMLKLSLLLQYDFDIHQIVLTKTTCIFILDLLH